MSFLGTIGHLMAGSGIQQVMETVFAKNAVGPILHGDAFARALRGHFLIDGALNVILHEQMFNICTTHELNDVDDVGAMEVDDDDLNEVSVVYQLLMEGNLSAEDASSSDALVNIAHRLEDLKKSLNHLRTSRLWFQYMDMVDILKKFIKAERTGNWMLHLQAVEEMLPYLASAGRHAYTKSARLYLQMMVNLEHDHPDTFRFFQSGLHVIRRTDRYWAGLSADLVIEQSFMRSLKSRGGLTRGRGMTEVQRAVWVSSMPTCSELNRAMQEFTGIAYQTSEQHKEVNEGRKARDRDDTLRLLQFFKHMSPFQEDPSLRSLSTGLVAAENVNVDSAKYVGNMILESMTGKNVNDYSFKRKEEAVTLADKTRVVVDGDVIQVDSQLLFQRFVLAAKAEKEDISDTFKYELCSQPPSLFDVAGLPLEANKPVLADTLWNIATKYDNILTTSIPTGYIQHVLDGGALLHRIPWPGKSTYNEIIQSYVSYVAKHYGHAIVVFDGYAEGPSTKDMTHIRRNAHGGIGASATIHFEGDMIIPLQKSLFLGNPLNKQCFLNMLGNRLTANNCVVHHAKSDADVLIVEKAVESAHSNLTVVIGEDTDLIILLCYYADNTNHDIFFTSEPKQCQKKLPRIWNIRRTKLSLGEDIIRHILFAHALLGCDTTSRVFHIGKGAAVRKIQTSAEFRSVSDVFNQEKSDKEAIARAGESALVLIYGGKINEDINSLRYRMFCEKTASGTTYVRAENLPPTKAATKFHSFRVFHQINCWKGIMTNPLDWGWISKGGKMFPVTTDLPPAPQNLLEVSRCSCKGDCHTLQCTCRKQGMNCSPACKVCRGDSCTNCPVPQDVSDDEEYA